MTAFAVEIRALRKYDASQGLGVGLLSKVMWHTTTIHTQQLRHY